MMIVNRPFLNSRTGLGALALTGLAGLPVLAQPAPDAKVVPTPGVAPAAKPARPAMVPPPPKEYILPPLWSRPLPQPSSRPMAAGPARFVDPVKGDDANDGSKGTPWKTVAMAVTKLQPGDTLYLRGGTYYEHVTVNNVGTADKPVTIRSYPGELAVIDNGLREFAESPATAWQPLEGGAPGEYVSTRTYPNLAAEEGRRGVAVLGRVLNTMVAIQGYKFHGDLISTNEYWTGKNNLGDDWSVYVGPGVWFNPETERIHVRLAPMTIPQFGDRRITVGSDPRQLPLSITAPGNAMSVDKASNLRIQDIVLRGALGSALDIRDSHDVTVDGVTMYAGNQALMLGGTSHLLMENSVLRGVSAPWSTRCSNKYRGNSPYILFCMEGNSDCEFAHNEITDGHDGPYLGTIHHLQFHHNIVDGFDDDGLYMNTGDKGGDIYVYENRFSRVLTNFSFSGSPTAPLHEGTYIFRNIFDLRQPTLSGPPLKPEDKTMWMRLPRMTGDHGSPVWQPLYFYQNTILAGEGNTRNYYAAGLGWAFRNTKRRVFNNIVVQDTEMPGLTFDTYGKSAKVEDDFAANNNLLWSISEGPKFEGDFFAKYRKSPEYQQTVALHAPGWTTGDIFAEPKLTNISAPLPEGLDVRPLPGSPAVNAGMVIPKEWPDPLRSEDKGAPDIGALPLGAAMPQYGPQVPTRVAKDVRP